MKLKNIFATVLCTVAFLACQNKLPVLEKKLSIDDIKHKDMVSISAMTIEGSDTADTVNRQIFKTRRTVKLSAYLIGRYEVSYELWYFIFKYAEANGYEIYNPGQGGSCGKEFEAPTEETKYQPVVKVSWNDAIVWCNAYSEFLGLKPVYQYQDKVVKSSWDKNGECSNVVMDKTANGFRLPTEAEWECAARGSSQKHKVDWGSGQNYAGTYQKNELKDYSWYAENSNGKTNSVGSKYPNRIGLYDMSGNVWEWCFDPFANQVTSKVIQDPISPVPEDFFTLQINKRQKRGGSFKTILSDLEELEVGYRKLGLSKAGKNDVGFRLARYNK